MTMKKLGKKEQPMKIARSDFRYANHWISKHPASALVIGLVAAGVAFVLYNNLVGIEKPPLRAHLEGCFFAAIAAYFLYRSWMGFKNPPPDA